MVRKTVKISYSLTMGCFLLLFSVSSVPSISESSTRRDDTAINVLSVSTAQQAALHPVNLEISSDATSTPSVETTQDGVEIGINYY